MQAVLYPMVDLPQHQVLLLDRSPKLQQRHHLTRQTAESGLLRLIKLARFGVQDAEGAQGVLVGRFQRHPGVEAHVGFTGDQRVADEPLVLGHVGDDEDVFLPDSIGADRNLPRGFARPVRSRTEPLPFGIDEIHHGDRGLADIGRKVCQIVELRLAQSIRIPYRCRASSRWISSICCPGITLPIKLTCPKKPRYHLACSCRMVPHAVMMYETNTD